MIPGEPEAPPAPGGGRALASPAFPDDDGSADPALRAILAGPDRGGAFVQALRNARLLASVVAVADEVASDGSEKASHMAVVSMVNARGERGLLAFTGLDSLAAWNAAARPVPALGRDVARSALADGAAAVVIDVAGPARVVIAGDELLVLADTVPPPRFDGSMSLGTRLSSQRYLDLLHLDGERLLEVAESSAAAPCPACEGWTVDDLVCHVGSVYAHQLAALRLGRAPAEGEWQAPPPEAGPQEHLAWCHAELHALAAELAHRPAAQAAWTWWPPERTVAFWQRRMALETAVHRVDAELAAGAVTPVAGDLALDGIDEVLHVMLAVAGVDDVSGPDVDDGRATVTVAGTTIAGPAPDLFLWLWGRGDAGRLVVLAGSAEDMRSLVRDATQ